MNLRCIIFLQDITLVFSLEAKNQLDIEWFSNAQGIADCRIGHGQNKISS